VVLILFAPKESMTPGLETSMVFPFFKNLVINLGWFYVAFAAVTIAGFSNAVNLTDGLDGLAIVPVMIAASTFGLITYLVGNYKFADYLNLHFVPGVGELAVVCGAIIGGGMGFLWYNAPPAKIFMGDTGSLALGGALAAVAILLKSEFRLLLVGAVFVAEMMSVILQRFVFKYRKRRYGIEYAREHRVFKRAPLHHHFEVKGWDEAQVVVRFWILGVLAAFIALSTLKLR
jgi:phospho-N-acetylmuramoyl-pentapeptide-transferase